MPQDLAGPDVDQQLVVTTGALDLDLLRFHGTPIVGNPFGGDQNETVERNISQSL